MTAQFPADTEGEGNVVLEPEVQADGTLQWELTASVIQWETEPGKVVEAYAYNGMVPGPQLRAEVGDKIRIILHNELAEPTTMHSHGLFVPPDMDGVPVISQPAVMPGESFTYEYTLRNAGSHMYHSHFMAERQVPMGLLGAFVVTDPSADEPAADQDIAMILNDGGILHDVTFADGTKISAEGHSMATGEVVIPATGMTFICSVPGHSDAGMTGEVMVGMATGSG